MNVVSIDNEADFTIQVLHKPGLVIVDFWASWCEPCKMIRSEIKRAAQTFDKYVDVVKVDVDRFHSLAEQYEVMAVPTLLFFDNGKPIKRIIGYATQHEIERLLHTLLPQTVDLDNNI